MCFSHDVHLEFLVPAQNAPNIQNKKVHQGSYKLVSK